MELIDKSEIAAEIEKKIKQYKNERNTIIKDTDNLKELSSRIIMCQEIISLLNTLETKEVDLKKEIQSWIEDNSVNGYYQEDVYETAEHFYELGLKMKGK